jgi:hypothetical protein
LELLHAGCHKDTPEDTPDEWEDRLSDVSEAFEAIGNGTFFNKIVATNAMLVTDEIASNTKIDTAASHRPGHIHSLLHHMTNGTRHTKK